MDVLDAEWGAADLYKQDHGVDESQKKIPHTRLMRASRIGVPVLRALTGIALFFGWGAALVVLLG